jgi:cytochrome c peroxidase
MKKALFLPLIALAVFIACNTEEPDILPVYDATPYIIAHGDFPPPPLPADNKPTVAGVELGRMLFYEKKLSKDGTQACADCHLQTDGFSDIRQFSLGVEGLPGGRQAMAVFNMAWHRNGLFWDGRSPNLRDQALRPIQDPLEMNETLENAIEKIKAVKDYRHQFIRAFGDEQVTAERMGLAMEQFMFTIVSFNAKHDQFLRGQTTLTESEMRGRELFFNEFDPISGQKGGECFHCHGGFNFTNDQFMNNGLDSDDNFTDLGRFLVTNLPADKAKFKTPSLRNIALTPPYMHDGRFATLEEVIEHYNSGVKQSSTVDFLLHFNLNPGLQLDQQDIADLVAFLHTLTDMDFVTNEAYASPF